MTSRPLRAASRESSSARRIVGLQLDLYEEDCDSLATNNYEAEVAESNAIAQKQQTGRLYEIELFLCSLCHTPSFEEGRRCCTCYHVAFLVQNRDQSAYRILWPHPRRTLPLFSLRDKKVRNTYAEASATSLKTSNTRYRALRLDRASLKATPTMYISTC